MAEREFRFSLTRIDPDWGLNQNIEVDKSRYIEKLSSFLGPEALLQRVQPADFLACEEDSLIILRVPYDKSGGVGFRFTPKGEKYIGQGAGDSPSQEGDVIGKESKGDQVSGDNNNLPGIDYFVVDVPLVSFMNAVWGGLKLPDLKPYHLSHQAPIQPKVHETARSSVPVGIDYRRSYLQAMKAGVLRSGRLTPVRLTPDDMVRKIYVPDSPNDNSVLIFAGNRSSLVEDRVLVLQRFFERYLLTDFREHFARVDIRYVVWADAAKEVDSKGFRQKLPSAFSRILTALQNAYSIVERCYSPTEWNINIFLLSERGDFQDTDRGEIVEVVRRLLSRGISSVNYVEFLHLTPLSGQSKLVNMLSNDLQDLIGKGLGLYQVKNLADLQKEMHRMFAG